MREGTLPLVIILTLTLLMTLPGTYSSARAIAQNGPTNFSPFGPFTPQMIIQYYSDYAAMFQNFALGKIDVSDWPLQSRADVTNFCSNPDFFCTTLQDAQGYFGTEINSHSSFMGIGLTQPRTVNAASFTVGSNTPGCSVGFGSLSIVLMNQETGATVKDSLNTLTAANQPSGSPSQTVTDSGGANPNGVYNVPCTLAGSYQTRTSVYSGTATVTVSSATVTSGTFNINWNSQSNSKPTQARALLGAAIAHLLDDPEFVSSTFGPLATPLCSYSVPSQGTSCPTGTSTTYLGGAGVCTPGPPACQNDNAECQFGNHPWLNNVACGAGNVGHDFGPYNINDDSVACKSLFWNPGTPGCGLGYSGHDDLRVACDDFVSMGLALAPPGATCNDVANAATASGTTDPMTYSHIVAPLNATSGKPYQIMFFIGNDLGRRVYGQIIADTLNFLFGTPSNRASNVGFAGTVCYGSSLNCTTPVYYSHAQVIDPVFGLPPTAQSPDAWQLYTSDQSFNPLPDQYFLYRNSVLTGRCAGTLVVERSNYAYVCNPQLDTHGSAGESAPSLTLMGQFFQRALIDDLNGAISVPSFTYVETFAENNGWNFQQCVAVCVNTQSSLVNTVGFGTMAGGAYWTLLNARQVPGYKATVAADQPVPGVIRRSFSQDTVNINPFTFTNAWEKEVLSDIFDTMLTADPNTGGATSQPIWWAITSKSSTFNPNEVSCNTSLGCATGTTTLVWHLRNDWNFADGNTVTANDVAYSLIAYRDVPSAPLQGYVISLSSAAGLDCGPGQPCKTLQLKIQGSSQLALYNFGATAFILERSLWAPYCGDPPTLNSICADPRFDPMYPPGNFPGILVGSGPWSCIVPTVGPGHAQTVPAGTVGGPCALSTTGDLTGGGVNPSVRIGKIALTANTNFDRCCPNGPASTTSSLYKISYADFNNDGVVNILDLAAVASAYGSPDPYWVNPNIAPGQTVGTVDLATVAIYFGHGVTNPFTPQSLVQVDPQIDPFFCPNTGC